MYVKEKRYITLLGDDIEKNKIQSSIFSKDALASTSVNAAVYGGFFNSETSLADMAMGTGLSHLQSTMLRHGFEKMFLGAFTDKNMSLYLDNEKLNTICIDKKPDEAASINSLSKYEKEINYVKRQYGFMAALYPAYQIGSKALSLTAGVDTEEFQNAKNALATEIAENSGALTRIFDGYNRFSKLSKGEWAIIDTPEHQEDLEEDKNYAPAMG